MQVEQQYLVTSMDSQHAALLAVIQEHMRADAEFKVMAFFTTARITQFYCALFNAMGISVLEMHSRKSQAQRTRAADQFRAAKRCIMFSSDVSARGVDYPDVSLVVQVSACPPGQALDPRSNLMTSACVCTSLSGPRPACFHGVDSNKTHGVWRSRYVLVS